MAIRARIRVEVAGRTVRGFPIETTVDAPVGQAVDYVREAEATFESLPASYVSPVRLLLLRNEDNPITLRFGGQTTAGCAVGARGIVAVVGGNMTAPPTVRNDDETANATIVGLVLGAAKES